MRYFKSGWLVLDFFATFPFDQALGVDSIYTRLIRLLRLTKLKALLDINKIKKIVKKLYEEDSSSENFQEY
jgi:hypothetical protein